MALGLLDLPAPIFSLLDSALAAVYIPAALRVAAYALVSALACMACYRRLSDQQQLADVRMQLRQTQQALAGDHDDFAQINTLIRNNLRLALRQLRLTLLPALLSSLPLLVVLPWLSNRFDLAAPAATALRTVCAVPANAATTLHWSDARVASAAESGCWHVPPLTADAATLLDRDGHPVFTLPAQSHSTVVTKFGWLNWFVANPDGYIADASAIVRIDVAAARAELLAWGPPWLRSWECVYFVTLIAVSALLRWRWRVL